MINDVWEMVWDNHSETYIYSAKFPEKKRIKSNTRKENNEFGIDYIQSYYI